MANVIRLFENTCHAQIYSKFRPTYPKELLERIFAFAAKQGVGSGSALDLACGSGQSTFHLCDHFRRTIGADISAAQIECALEKAKESGRSDDVEFVVSPANSLPFEDESVDLITCAQAWHWLDPDTVFSEIDRVLKRPGALAVYGYSRGVMHHQQCEKLLSHYYSKTLTWHSNRKFIDNLYHDVKLPYPLLERFDTQEETTLSMEGFKGYLSTWSAYQSYCEEHPGTTVLEDLVQQFKKLLSEETPGTNSNLSVHLSTSYFLLLCLKS